MPTGSAAESCLHGAVAVEDERGRRLHDVEMPCDIGTVGHVDVEVAHTVVVGGECREGAVDTRAPRAHLGAELQQSGRFAERLGPQAVRFDDLVGDVPSRAGFEPPHNEADADRQHQECCDGDERADEIHSHSE